MSSNIRLDYVTASTQAKLVLDGANEVNRILGELVSEMESNLNNKSVWAGDSATKFQNAWNNCADNFNNFVEYLKSVQGRIDSAAEQAKSFDSK